MKHSQAHSEHERHEGIKHERFDLKAEQGKVKPPQTPILSRNLETRCSFENVWRIEF